MMWEDPIVMEIRRIREAHAAKFDYNVQAIVEDARKRQNLVKDKVVSFASKRPKSSQSPA